MKNRPKISNISELKKKNRHFFCGKIMKLLAFYLLEYGLLIEIRHGNLSHVKKSMPTVFSVLVAAGTIFLCVKKPSIIGLMRLLFQVRLLLDLNK